MKNKSIILFATVILFTACSNSFIKKDVKVHKVPTPKVEFEEEMPVIEAPPEPVGGEGSLPPVP